MNYTVLHIMYSNIFPDDGVLSCSVLTFIFKIESMEEYAPGIFLQSFCGIKKGLPLVDKLICPLFQPNFLHFHVGWRPAPPFDVASCEIVDTQQVCATNSSIKKGKPYGRTSWLVTIKCMLPGIWTISAVAKIIDIQCSSTVPPDETSPTYLAHKGYDVGSRGLPFQGTKDDKPTLKSWSLRPAWKENFNFIELVKLYFISLLNNLSHLLNLKHSYATLTVMIIQNSIE